MTLTGDTIESFWFELMVSMFTEQDEQLEAILHQEEVNPLTLFRTQPIQSLTGGENS